MCKININLKKKINYKMHKINIIYFVWINPKKNFKSIIEGQLTDVLSSNILGHSKIYIQVCCEYIHLVQEIEDIFKEKLQKIEYDIHFYSENRFEYYGIKKMYDLAVLEPDKYFLYFHSKGMFNYDNIERHNYEKILTKGTIYQFKKCIQLFEKNPTIMKIGLFPSNVHKHNFIWFNFYWARGSYLLTCQDPIITKNRFYYETWSETGDNNMGLVYNLHENNFKKYELHEAGDILNKLKGIYRLE